jgi:hypothetical protein
MKYEELTQAPRRRKWPWIVAVLIIAGIALAIAWRWMPPGDATMAQVRAAEVAYESVLAPGATRVRGLPVSDAAFVSETITFTKDDGVWKIAGDQHFGG